MWRSSHVRRSFDRRGAFGVLDVGEPGQGLALHADIDLHVHLRGLHVGMTEKILDGDEGNPGL